MAPPRKWRNSTKTKLYSVWCGMRHRCYATYDPRYADYGGRGIEVCERWHDYDLFVEDVGPQPEGMTLNRIDNDGDYEPGNWEWATQSEQARNRSSTHMLTHGGETLPLIVWAERTGIPLKTLWKRLNYGMSPEKALTPGDLRR